MKISTKGRYGLRIMLDLARNDGDKPRMIGDICKEQNLSRKYAGRLIIALRKAGMITSVRGAKGGYKINRLPREISLLEILETMEGRVSIVDCVECPQKCERANDCTARNIWCDLNKKIRSELAAISLQSILNRQTESDDYCI